MPSVPMSARQSDRVSAKDFDRYADSGVTWRVIEGSVRSSPLPAQIASHHLAGARHRSHGKRPRVETTRGAIAAVRSSSPSQRAAGEGRPSPRRCRKNARRRRGSRSDSTTSSSWLDSADEFDATCAYSDIPDRAATPRINQAARTAVRRRLFRRQSAAELEANGDGASTTRGIRTGGRVRQYSRAPPQADPIHRWGSIHCARQLPRMRCRDLPFAVPRLPAVEDQLFFASEAVPRNDFQRAPRLAHRCRAADQVLAARLA